MPDAKAIEWRSMWLPLLINTALLFLFAPLAYWAALCVSSGPFHFGLGLVFLVGFVGTYFCFGFALLLACVGATAATFWLTRCRPVWRLPCSAIAGVVIGALLGFYVILKLTADAHAINNSTKPDDIWDWFLPAPVAGLILGLLLPILWRISCRWAKAVSKPYEKATGPA